MKQVYLLLAFERRALNGADEVGGAPSDQFWVADVPFPFSSNAILIGVDLTTGDTADRPVMSIDEFGRLITFVGPHGRRYQSCLVPRMASSWEAR